MKNSNQDVDQDGRQLSMMQKLYNSSIAFTTAVVASQVKQTVQNNYLFHRDSSEASMPARSRVTQNVLDAGREERGRPLHLVLDSRPP